MRGRYCPFCRRRSWSYEGPAPVFCLRYRLPCPRQSPPSMKRTSHSKGGRCADAQQNRRAPISSVDPICGPHSSQGCSTAAKSGTLCGHDRDPADDRAGPAARTDVAPAGGLEPDRIGLAAIPGDAAPGLLCRVTWPDTRSVALGPAQGHTRGRTRPSPAAACDP